MSAGPRKVLLDTDIGSDVDDALALALVLASPELELVGVTTVSSDVASRARLASGMLELAGRSDVPVWAGESRPLLREARRFNWFGHEVQCVPEGTAGRFEAEPAPEQIARIARETPGIEILMIGPLTNLARALALEPELPRLAGGVSIMGGHVREVKVGDRVMAPGVDYNLCSDPEASMAVLGAGFRVTLVTADVTLRTWLRERDLARLEASGTLGRELVREVRLWAPLQRRIFTGLGGTLEDDNVAFLHDPLTALALVDPSALVFEELAIVPTIAGGVLRTVEVDPAPGLGAAMRVATSVDPPEAERAIVARLCGRGAP